MYENENGQRLGGGMQNNWMGLNSGLMFNNGFGNYRQKVDKYGMPIYEEPPRQKTQEELKQEKEMREKREKQEAEYLRNIRRFQRMNNRLQDPVSV